VTFLRHLWEWPGKTAKLAARLAGKIDTRDVLAAAGLGLAWVGLERIYPGAGSAAVGGALFAAAMLVR